MAESIRPSPPRRRKPLRRRWYVRLLTLLVLLYVAANLTLYFLQASIAFPGTRWQGTPQSRIFLERGTQLVHLQLPDKTPIAALFAPAVDPSFHPLPDPRLRPTFLYFYGNGSAVAGSRDEVDRFRELGVNVLVADYPGFGQSGGHISEAEIYATADVCWAWSQSQPDRVDPEQIISVGWSLGGAAAVDLASREPVEGLITFNAFTTMPAMARKLMPWIATTSMVAYDFDNLSKIAGVKCPALIVSGKLDTLIPGTMSDALARAAAGPASRLVLPNANHNTIFTSDAGQLYPAMARFLRSLRPVETTRPATRGAAF